LKHPSLSSSGKTILITGATGFLGSSITKCFLSRGYNVAILKRKTSPLSRLSTIADKILSFDVEDGLSKPFEVCGEIDTVVHTAVDYGRNGQLPEALYEVNTIFPLKLLFEAIRNKVNMFVNADTALQSHVNAYSLSKHQLTEWGRLLGCQYDFRFINMRLEHMYGPGDDEKKFPHFVIKSLLRNVPELLLTPGEQKRDFVYIDDVVSAYDIIMATIPQKDSGFYEFSIGSGVPLSIRDFTEKAKILTGSATILKFGALPYRKNEVMLSMADIRAIKNLGWVHKVMLDEGMKKMVESEKSLCVF